VPITAVSAAPVQIYVPPSNGNPTAFITNSGPNVVYLGGANVTSTNGLPLPANQSLDLSRMGYSIYAVTGYNVTATATTLSAAENSGATSLAITAGTGTANGQTILVGSGSAAEVVSITSGGGTTTLTTTATQYDHKTGAAVTVVTSLGSSVNVVAGTN
jgi:hypothetical protein